MTQPLNYTPKAIEQLLGYPCPSAPGAREGMQYLANKLREAQVFILPDNGELLDRTKARPDVPGAVFRPAFPVVALEYTASRATGDPSERYYNAACTKRIALAWDWQNDLPPTLAALTRPDIGPGVVIASIAFYDHDQRWMPVCGAMHIPYDDTWMYERRPAAPYILAAVRTGSLNKAQLDAPLLRALPIPILPEPMFATASHLQGFAAAIDSIQSDMSDEVSAYTDLCYALSCKNVLTRNYPAPANLNRSRAKAGKLPLKDFHVLELVGSGGASMPGASSGERGSPRSHLRRGHIRRLDLERMTWVNSTIVRGRGFTNKVYAA